MTSICLIYDIAGKTICTPDHITGGSRLILGQESQKEESYYILCTSNSRPGATSSPHHKIQAHEILSYFYHNWPANAQQTHNLNIKSHNAL